MIMRYAHAAAIAAAFAAGTCAVPAIAQQVPKTAADVAHPGGKYPAMLKSPL